MKTKILLAGLLATGMMLEVSAQRAEYDDMYFRGKDRERNKSISADEAFASDIKKQKSDDVVMDEEDSNPTDSYSARNVNPEYISRSNSEQASEDEANYYLEGYNPAPATNNFNNSYYNNANWGGNNWARNSFYGNSMWNSPYNRGCFSCDPWMNPYGGFGGGYGGFYDPWMMPMYGGMGMGPSFGWGSPWGFQSGFSVSLMYGNAWGYNPWGWGGNPYYGGGYGGGYYEPVYTTYSGRRPSRNSAVVTPNQRVVTRTRTTEGVTTTGRTANVNNRTTTRVRTRQAQDEYYVRPSQRTSESYSRPSNNRSFSNPGNSPFRTRDFSSPSRSGNPAFSPSPSPSRSSSPSFSPSRSNSGSSGGNSGGGTRSRGRN